ncbi:MAG: DUF1722 domain-containing protein [Pseudomonadota bacterium]
MPVGISERLLGAPVRFDGGHRHAEYCTGELADWFAWTPVCPEMAIGMGVPREAIHRADGVPERDNTRGLYLQHFMAANPLVPVEEDGRLLADLTGADLDAVAGTYIAALMRGLQKPVTRKGHSNVLQHIAGYFRDTLPPAHRQRLATVIDDYLARQVYLAPHPDPLRLRAFL